MNMQFHAKAGATIEPLFAYLEMFEREYDNLPHDTDNDVINLFGEIQWMIRGLISATPARTLSDFRLKALVFKKEAERDADFECDALGSARELAKSLVNDALAMIAAV